MNEHLLKGRTYLTALGAGLLFYFLHIPLPWILGPVAGLMLFKLSFKKKTGHYHTIRNAAFSLLGIQIGLTFTAETFRLVGPYFFPYTLLSLLMILISLAAAYLISSRTDIDPTTSLIGAAPGGLSAMIAVSESFRGNTVLVTIFHTIRLMAVLFIVPFIAVHWLQIGDGSSTATSAVSVSGPWWTGGLYVIVFLLGYKTKSLIPASLVILPMLIIGSLQAGGVALLEVPDVLFIGAQLVIGVHLGHSIMVEDLIKAGKYCIYYFMLAIVMIGIGMAAGLVLSMWTGMDILTAVLALAPGGLVEMAITASNTGGEPAIVSSLQTIRLLTIVLILPFFFRWLLPKVNQ